MKKFINTFILIFCILVFCFVLIKNLFPYLQVGSHSMEPTIQLNSIIFTNRLAYTVSRPKTGDIIVIQPVSGIFEKGYWVHRIIAEPGDDVLIENGLVLVNGSVSPYGSLNNNKFVELTVPDGQYFQKGDSPETIFGLISEEDIYAKYLFQISQ